MTVPSQPSDPLVGAVLAILKAARELGFEINKTKLVKLLYFADIQAIEQGGVQFSGATWRWDNFGPFDRAIAAAELQLADSNLIERRDDRLFDGQCLLTLAVEVDDPLPAEYMTIVRDVVTRHGSKSATALKVLSYKTPPMEAASAAGDRGVLLDLNRARRRRNVQAMLARSRVRRATIPRHERSPGVADELLAELEASSDSIRRANEVLGDR